MESKGGMKCPKHGIEMIKLFGAWHCDECHCPSSDEWPTESELALQSQSSHEEGWVRVEDKKPCEKDEVLLVTNGYYTEIVWFEDKTQMFQKPMRYDDDDTPAFKRLDEITYWMPLPKNLNP